uniref:GST N-terminal domain-containing protein n=1 Tax=Pseudo-nitzschia australis TaxID=44445 RepID=A0A7S4AKU8_9STRA|mmetsp:Transcript_22051/g.46748  ORF Transcript_22051/g.46748 Transcript_22051/m.46748 type:complete len:266 (-) Transcript_22051:189-986(-)
MSGKKTSIRLLGVPLSQPFTSCAWTTLQLGVPFEIEIAVPGASSKMGTKHENFQNLTSIRSTKVPVLVDGDIALAESPAIMAYLCERYGSENGQIPNLYASPGSEKKAMIDSYMHWHHTNTRSVAKLFGSKVRPDLKANVSEREHTEIQNILTIIDSGWLRSSPYIGGLDTPSIADILAYGELSTVTTTNLLSVKNFSNISSWMNRMTLLPYHDESHVALATLGDLSDDNNSTPLMKRLGAATKAGMKSILGANDEAMQAYTAKL